MQMFPSFPCDQCGQLSSYTRISARDTASEETVRVCPHCDDLGRWRQSPYIQGILARIDASADAWLARAPFAHQQPPTPSALLVQEWLADMLIWCAAHDLDLTTVYPHAVRDAQRDRLTAEEAHDDDEDPTK